MQIDNREFRDALGTFPTGVCIITAHPQGQKPFGMTANSFAAVSLDPALILWSLQNSSDCFDGFSAIDKFAVSVLASDQLALSDQYARRNSHDLKPQHFRLGKSGLPIIRGAVSSFECNIWAKNPGGDHVIFIGEVTHFESNANKQPLVFSSGQYCALR